MDISIKKARLKDASPCLECVKHSALWDAYYKNSSVLDSITDAIRRKEVYVALNKNDKCIGFMGIVPRGGFGEFSYLSILAVKKNYRNKNIGKMLLDKFEALAFKDKGRAFVLCSDFNEDAQKFYMKYDYKKCGKIPDMYKTGIAEHIFVKVKV